MCKYLVTDDKGNNVTVEAFTEELAKVQAQKKLDGSVVSAIKDKPIKRKRAVETV